MSAPLNAHLKPRSSRASMSPPPDIMSQSNDEDKDSDYNNDIRDDSLGSDALRDIDDTVAQPYSRTRGLLRRSVISCLDCLQEVPRQVISI
jgi:hypothetical protein